MDLSSLGLLINDIKKGLRHVPEWTMQHIDREANQIAHKLAQMATSRAWDEKWFAQPPECITECLAMELYASSTRFYF